MYALGIDTSTLTGGVALLKNRQLIGESVLNIRTTHSERLLPSLEKLLLDANVDSKELDVVAVVTGPGSFTGIRIGVATGKGMCYALGKPLVGLTSLEVFGWQFKYFSGLVIPLVDARRKNVYWQAFRQGQSVNLPTHGSLGDVIAFCNTYADEQILFVGDGAINYSDHLREEVVNSVFPPVALSLLKPGAVADLGHIRFSQGLTGDAFNINPTYMRKTEAELKWQERT